MAVGFALLCLFGLYGERAAGGRNGGGRGSGAATFGFLAAFVLCRLE
jgi:hypothetical protein